MLALFVMTLFWASNVTGIAIGGPASFTYWLLCALGFFVPCVIVIAQLGQIFPHEGSIYSWTYHALGRGWSFFVSTCAWLPGVLSVVSAAFVFVSCLQALNAHWLIPVWQQGLVILGVVLFAGLAATQRLRTIQDVTNVAALLTGVAVLLIGGAGVVWLLTGHRPATDFHTGWQINLDLQTGNSGLLGTATLALLGASMPLTLAGEIKEGTSISHHLKWGSLLVVIGYLALTFGLLAVQGAGAAQNTANPIVLLIATVDSVFGKLWGNITAVCLMCFFVVVPIVENVVSARLLMVAAIDLRLPTWLGRLNTHRAPANAVLFQTLILVAYTIIVFFVLPLLSFLGNSVNLTNEVYDVTAASLLLVWAFSFLFPFIDVAVLYFRRRALFMQQRIVPLWLLACCCIAGPIVCLLTMAVTLYYSFIPQLIPNQTWLEVVGGLTLIFLLISGIGGLFASGEASWEGMRG